MQTCYCYCTVMQPTNCTNADCAAVCASAPCAAQQACNRSCNVQECMSVYIALHQAANCVAWPAKFATPFCYCRHFCSCAKANCVCRHKLCTLCCIRPCWDPELLTCCATAPALHGSSQHKARLVIGHILVQHACERLTHEGTCSWF